MLPTLSNITPEMPEIKLKNIILKQNAWLVRLKIELLNISLMISQTLLNDTLDKLKIRWDNISLMMSQKQHKDMQETLEIKLKNITQKHND